MRLNKKIIMAVVFVAAVGINGYGQSHDIEGVWIVNIDQTLENMSISGKERYERLPPNVKENLRSSFDGRKFIFLPDGIVKISYSVRGQSKEAVGNYIYVDSENALSIKLEGNAHHYFTDWENSYTLTLVFEYVGQNAVLESLYLTKE